MAYVQGDPWAEEAVQRRVDIVHSIGISPESTVGLWNELHRVRALRQPLHAPFDDIVCNWPLTPVSVCHTQPAVERGSTQPATHCLRTAILLTGGGVIRFEPSWIQDDVRRVLERHQCTQANASFLLASYPSPEAVIDRWIQDLTDESTVVSFIHAQLQRVLVSALVYAFPRTDGTNYRFTSAPAGQSSSTRYGTNKPDFLFGLVKPSISPRISTVLLSGEVKLEITMPLIVMRWIIWWSRQEYKLVLDEPRGGDTDQNKALIILRQVWCQQVSRSVQRLFLTNGNAFIFFAAKPPSRIDSYVSNIYFHDGRFDPYDGQEIPTAVDLVPGLIPAPWPHAPGLLAALAASSLLCAEDGQVWDDVPEEDVEVLSPATATTGSSNGSVYHPGPSATPSAGGIVEEGALSHLATRRAPQPITVNRAFALQGLHRVVSQLFQPSHLAEFRAVDVFTGSAADPIPYSTVPVQFRTPELVPSISTTQSSPSSILLTPRSVADAQGSPPLQLYQKSSSHKARTSQPRLRFETLLGTGSFADVFGGTLSVAGTLTPCVFKFIHSDTFARRNWGPKGRPCSSKTAIRTLRNEARVLGLLAGQAIAPELLGYWEGKDVGGRGYAVLAMDELGSHATAALPRHEKVAIIRLIDKLHNAGFVHGDVDLRHVRRQRSESCSVQGDDHWRLIDFERAFTADVESITHERKHLCDLLGVDDSVEL